LNPDAFFMSDAQRDFTIVAISAESSAILNKEARGFLPLATKFFPTPNFTIQCFGFPNGFVFSFSLRFCAFVCAIAFLRASVYAFLFRIY
jgi:hypothetical protein